VTRGAVGGGGSSTMPQGLCYTPCLANPNGDGVLGLEPILSGTWQPPEDSHTSDTPGCRAVPWLLTQPLFASFKWPIRLLLF